MPRLATVFFCSIALFAQDSRWQQLHRVPEGTRLNVRLNTGEDWRIRLQRWETHRLVLLNPEQRSRSAIERSEIARITKRSRARGALIGFLVGFAVGYPVGAFAGPYIADYGNPSAGTRLRHGAGWGLFTGGIGAGIGVGLGKQVTIYRGAP
jgi:hypothetical protein